MPNRFASGRIAIAECDRCGQQYQLKKLRTEIVKQRKYEILVCPECWDPDQPQLMLGTFPVDDPQALRNPRPDRVEPLVVFVGVPLVEAPQLGPVQAFGQVGTVTVVIT